MKKILHISKYYYPFSGGIEQTARDCVCSLKDSYEQKVICFNEDNRDDQTDIDEIDVIRCGTMIKISSQPLSRTYEKNLKNIINDFRPDIIIFHYPNPYVATLLLRYITDEIKLIVYWHLDIVRQKFLRILFVNQNKNLIERANVIIATSPNYISGSKYLSSVKDKCVVIPSCINAKRMAISKETLLISDKIRKQNSNKIICLAVGRHTRYKGMIYLIKASEKLDDRFKIFIIGEGEQTEYLKRKAKNNKRIQFLGRVEDKILKAYLLACDIFCFPSISKNEAFGLALAEAMFYKKPAVTFTIPGSGVNYVCLNGECGYEVDNKNIDDYARAMIRLADDPELRNSMGQEGRKRVLENFMDIQFKKKFKETVDKMGGGV